MTNYLVLDIETNGIGTFRPPSQTPIQVSFQHLDCDGNLLNSYSEFIKGVKKIQWGGSIGECPWDVDFVNKEGVSIASCIQAIKNCIDNNTVIIGHNIEFDISTLLHKRHSKTIALARSFCTMKSTVEFCKIKKTGYGSKYGGYKWPKLAELSGVLNINVDHELFHDSKYDVEITKKCFFKLKELNVINL